MKIRIASDRPTWRDRFVEISRQVEGLRAPQTLVVAVGLKLRLKTSAFAAPRRSRLA